MNLKKTHLLFLLALLSFSCSKNDSESNTINKTVTEQDKQAAASVLDVDRTINELEFIARSIKTAYPNKPGILSGTTITEGQTTEGKAQYDIVFTGNASGISLLNLKDQFAKFI